MARRGWFAARPSGTENIYKIYAESFVDQAHLDTIVAEARAIVDRAMGFSRMSTRGASVPPFPPGYRASGVLLHVTSLPSPYGIGDLGPAAFAWVDRLHEAGQRWWQALPLGPTGYGDSPYQCLSSFAGNELLISPDGLIDDGLLRAADCARAGVLADHRRIREGRSVQTPPARDRVEPLQRRRPSGPPTRL